MNNPKNRLEELRKKAQMALLKRKEEGRSKCLLNLLWRMKGPVKMINLLCSPLKARTFWRKVKSVIFLILSKLQLRLKPTGTFNSFNLLETPRLIKSFSSLTTRKHHQNVKRQNFQGWNKRDSHQSTHQKTFMLMLKVKYMTKYKLQERHQQFQDSQKATHQINFTVWSRNYRFHMVKIVSKCKDNW